LCCVQLYAPLILLQAGLIEEMIADTLDEGDEMEEAAEEEVDKILMEITQGVLNKGQKPPQNVIKQPEPVHVEPDLEEGRHDDALAARLAALRQ
jgi:charged multivesicular body protein 3